MKRPAGAKILDPPLLFPRSSRHAPPTFGPVPIRHTRRKASVLHDVSLSPLPLRPRSTRNYCEFINSPRRSILGGANAVRKRAVPPCQSQVLPRLALDVRMTDTRKRINMTASSIIPLVARPSPRYTAHSRNRSIRSHSLAIRHRRSIGLSHGRHDMRPGTARIRTKSSPT